MFAASEARAAGWGGVAAVAEITGLARSRIIRGLKDLDGPALERGRIRRAAGGRHRVTATDSTLLGELKRLVEPATMGDPMRPADERVIDPLEKAGKTTVIPPKANSKHKRDYDKELYKARHLIENFFAKLKQFAPSLPVMTSGRSTSWPESTSLRSSFGSIEDRP